MFEEWLAKVIVLILLNVTVSYSFICFCLCVAEVLELFIYLFFFMRPLNTFLVNLRAFIRVPSMMVLDFK